MAEQSAICLCQVYANRKHAAPSFGKRLHLPASCVPLSVAVFAGVPYIRRWDTLPQRRAHICEDTSNGEYQTGYAAG